MAQEVRPVAVEGWKEADDAAEAPSRTEAPSRRCRCRRPKCRCCNLTGALSVWFSFTRWRDWLQGDGRGQLVSLLAAAAILILAGTVTWSAIGGDENADDTFEQSIWMSWGLFFDPGTQTGVSANAATKVKATALIFSVLGFLYNLTFLGIIVEWIRSSMDHWTRTKSRVWYGQHTLILGWSEKTLYLLNELFEKQVNSGITQHVVIAAARDESEMRQEVKQHFYQLWEELPFFDRRWRMLKSLKLREGEAHDSDALERANASRAEEIIILSRDGNPRSADLETVRIMVALSSLRETVQCRIFAEAQAQEVEIVLRRLHAEKCQVIRAREACNQILALLATDQMVGGCLADLYSFAGGDEIYVIQPLEAWQTFKDARKAFDTAVCIGVQVADKSDKDAIILAPEDGRSFIVGERLLVMASSIQDVQIYSSILQPWRHVSPSFMGKISALTGIGTDTAAEEPEDRSKEEPRSTDTTQPIYVIIGWPSDLGDILKLMNRDAQPGTEVHVLSERTEEQRRALGPQKLEDLANLVLHDYVGPRTSISEIGKLKEPLKQAAKCGAVLILAQLALQRATTEQVLDDDEVGDDTLTSDASCLTSLLVIADLLELGGQGGKLERQASELKPVKISSFEMLSNKTTNIICEVLDPRTEQAVSRGELQKLAFFFRSKAVETGIFMMAMSEPSVHQALLQLMSPLHPSLQVQPIERYWKDEGEGSSTRELGQKSWFELADEVRSQNDALLVGWRRQDKVCRLSPTAGKAKKETWSRGDQLMVIQKPKSMMPSHVE